jgi:hypothetical protein
MLTDDGFLWCESLGVLEEFSRSDLPTVAGSSLKEVRCVAWLISVVSIDN